MKPANIRFTAPTPGSSSTGASVAATGVESVKVLDFGLAKALEEQVPDHGVTQSPTITAMATREGVILGTAAYMSPEQARGHAADRRSDIWSFGAVLYEMLVGRRPFAGDTVSDTLAAVLRAEPDFSALPTDTPPAVRRLLRRCLEKDPRHRLQAIGDARISLENVLAGRDEDEALDVAGAVARRLPAVVPMLAGLVLGGVITAGAWWTLQPEPPAAPRLRKIPITLPADENGLSSDPAISPDGTKLVYLVAGKLVLRRLDQWETVELQGTEEAEEPFWSPDSRHIAFGQGQKLIKLAVETGQSTVLCALDRAFRGGTWRGDGTIAFIAGVGPIMQVSERGGEPAPLVELDTETERDFHEVEVLPDGRSLVLIAHPTGGAPDRLEIWTEGARREILHVDGTWLFGPRFAAPGYIVFARGGGNAGIWAVPFSADSMTTSGEPFIVAPGGSDLSVSRDGTLVHLTGASRSYELVWVDRDGNVVDTVGQPQDLIWYPALSPDGRFAAVAGVEGEEWDIWVHDLERGTKTRLTFDGGRQIHPAWHPTGKNVAYLNVEGASVIQMRAADGSGDVVTLMEAAGDPSFAGDGGVMAVDVRREDGTFDLSWARLGGEQPLEAISFSATPGVEERRPAVSPDGRFVAYQSDESGDREIYIRRFPEGEGKWQVSTAGGGWPVWSREGTELYYAEGSAVMSVSVEVGGSSVRLGRPERLFNWMAPWLVNGVGFDVSQDGRLFLMVRPVGDETEFNEIRIVENWLLEFEGAE